MMYFKYKLYILIITQPISDEAQKTKFMPIENTSTLSYLALIL